MTLPSVFLSVTDAAILIIVPDKEAMKEGEAREGMEYRELIEVYLLRLVQKATLCSIN